jgi:hypothetical protein
MAVAKAVRMRDMVGPDVITCFRSSSELGVALLAGPQIILQRTHDAVIRDFSPAFV